MIVRKNCELFRRFKLVATGKLCTLYYSKNNLRVSTFNLELFGGGEFHLVHHLYLKAGLKYLYSEYNFRRRDQDKDLEYSQTGLVVGLHLKV